LTLLSAQFVSGGGSQANVNNWPRNP